MQQSEDHTRLEEWKCYLSVPEHLGAAFANSSRSHKRKTTYSLARFWRMFTKFEPVLNSRRMQSHSGHNEACFQKAVISRGRRRILRRVRRTHAVSR
jgi:hypothetical protein